MVAYFPAPGLCQMADEDLIIEIGSIVFPDFVDRTQKMNGLRLKVEGNPYQDRSLVKIATDRFQILLGILRAWRHEAGQRADEIRPGIGAGSIRDGAGNQIVRVGTVIDYTIFGSEVESYARDAKIALENSEFLRNALWLHGRRDRNSDDFYMIYEYAEKDFAGPKAIVATLGVAAKDIDRLTDSANNLAPIEGGRHVSQNRAPEWGLDAQKRFIATFLRKWIEHRARC